MATARFGLPYLWVTHIAGLLSGEDRCRWAAWFKAHFQYDKVENDDFDSAGYATVHKELLNRRVTELRRDGWLVTTERQNSFKYKGQTAVLGGKPDILAVKDDRVLVVDAKTGVRRHKYVWQVMIYMAVLPRVRIDLARCTVEGEVYYASGDPVRISAAELTQDNVTRIWEQVRQSAAPEVLAPEKSPSDEECAFCNIPAYECPERLAVTVAVGETTNF